MAFLALHSSECNGGDNQIKKASQSHVAGAIPAGGLRVSQQKKGLCLEDSKGHTEEGVRGLDLDEGHHSLDTDEKGLQTEAAAKQKHRGVTVLPAPQDRESKEAREGGRPGAVCIGSIFVPGPDEECPDTSSNGEPVEIRCGEDAVDAMCGVPGSVETQEIFTKDQVNGDCVCCYGGVTFSLLPSSLLRWSIASKHDCCFSPQTTSHRKPSTGDCMIINHVAACLYRNPFQLGCISHQSSFARDLQL